MGIEDYGIDDEVNSANEPLHHKEKYISTHRHSPSSPTTRKAWKPSSKSKNYKEIFTLSFDALRERKARSALTILMVVVGGALMVALNGMSAGQSAFMNKQMSMLAPNVLFVSSGQMNFRGPQGPPTIVLNNEVVNRIKSLPFVQEVAPSYQGQLADECTRKYSEHADNIYGSAKDLLGNSVVAAGRRFVYTTE